MGRVVRSGVGLYLAAVAAGEGQVALARVARAQMVGLNAQMIVEPHGQRLSVQHLVAVGGEGDLAAALIARGDVDLVDAFNKAAVLGVDLALVVVARVVVGVFFKVGHGLVFVDGPTVGVLRK